VQWEIEERGINLDKKTRLSTFIIALLSVCLVAMAISNAIEVRDLQKNLVNTQQELVDAKQEQFSLEQNYTFLQQIFTPKIETELGAKVLWDPSACKNYLWVTGEVYNRGYGMAYNTVLEVKVFDSSDVPKVIVLNLGDIDAHNYKSVYNAFYSDSSIKSWTLGASCSLTK
jgi:hypothetical protein